MEDRHSIEVNMKGHQNWSFFAVFDGHAGYHSAEFCEKALIEEMEEKLKVLVKYLYNTYNLIVSMIIL